MRWMLLALLGCSPGTATVGDDTGTTPTGSTTPAGSTSTTTTSPTTGTPTTTTATTPTGPRMEVGSQELVHSPLNPGDPVRLVFGGQGGFHIEVSGEVWELGEAVLVDARVDLVADDSRIAASEAETAVALMDYDPATDSGWFAGHRALLDDNALMSVCPLQDQAVRICVRATGLVDPDNPIEACAEGIAQLPPDQLAYCGTP